MVTKHNDSINLAIHRHNGLSKREWFAGLAMQGLLANSYQSNGTQSLSEVNICEIAQLAVDQVDALIKCLNDNKKEE